MKQSLQVLLFISIVLMGYVVVDSVNQPIRFNKAKDARQKAVVGRLVDIRTAQVAFKNKYGHYTSSFDSLIGFVKFDSLPLVNKQGALTDSMIEAGITEKKAMALGIIIRDTTYISVKEEIFTKDYPIDSLAIVPFTVQDSFKMEAGSVTTQSSVEVKVFQAFVPNEVYLHGLDEQEIINLNAFASKYSRYPGLKVGNILEANNNAGNWE